MKKIIAALAVVALLAGGIWFFREKIGGVIGDSGILTVLDPPPTVAREEGAREPFFYSRLSPEQKLAYDEILAVIRDFPEKIRVSRIDEDDFNLVHHALVYDNPDLFFLSNAAYMEFRSLHCYYRPEYLCGKEEYDARLAQVEGLRDEIFRSIPEGADDYTKEKILHDAVISRCEYGEGTNDSDVYGALVGGRAVCAGYAKVVKYLLDSLGIYNYLVIGEAENSRGRESHMWNTVYVGGEPYYLDVTWDDGDSGEDAGYTFFNVTQAAVAASHFPENPADSGCVFTSQNYFLREGLYYETWDGDVRDRIGEALTGAVALRKTGFDAAFADADVRKAAVDALIPGQEIYALFRAAAQRTGVEMRTDFINYSVNEERNVLHIDLTKNYEGSDTDG